MKENKKEFKIGDYVYYKDDCEKYVVGQIFDIEEGCGDDKFIWCCWSVDIDKLPKTIKEFNKIKIRPQGFMFDNKVFILNLIDDTNIDIKEIANTKTTTKTKNTVIKYTIDHIIHGNESIVIVHNEDDKKYLKGMAKYNSEDPKGGFNEYEGFCWAYARATGNEMKLIKNLSDYSNEELFDEIHRRLKL